MQLLGALGRIQIIADFLSFTRAHPVSLAFEVALCCRDCGSLVGYRRASRPDHMDVTAGTLDDPGRYPPTVEIWLEQRIHWEPLDPDLPKRERSRLNEEDAA